MSKFRIEFVVDSAQLGEVLAKIHGQVSDLDVGVVEVVPHNKNARRSKKQPVEKKKGRSTGRKPTERGSKGDKQLAPRGATRELIMNALNESPDRSMSLRDGFNLLKDSGFVGDGIYGLKSSLIKKGLISYRDGKMTLVQK